MKVGDKKVHFFLIIGQSSEICWFWDFANLALCRPRVPMGIGCLDLRKNHGAIFLYWLQHWGNNSPEKVKSQFIFFLYLCQFNLDFHETLNISSLGPKFSNPGCLSQMATLGVGAFPNFPYFSTSLPIQLGFLWKFKLELLGSKVVYSRVLSLNGYFRIWGIL